MLWNLIFIFLLLFAPNAMATQYFVRDGGGSYGSGVTTCNGLFNTKYVTGAGPNCAWNTPRIAFGYCTTGGGEGRGGGWPPCSVGGHLVSGDTLTIIGDSDINPGQQAKFNVGYADDGTGQTPACSNVTANTCEMGQVGSGITIQGQGAHKPQLWENEGEYYGLYLNGSNITLSNFELTQHSSCVNEGINPGNPGYGIYPSACGGTSGNYPYGPSVAAAGWGKYGLYVENGVSNLTTNNLWVHGLGNNDIFFDGVLTTWNSTNDKFDGGGQAIDDGPSMTFGGTNTMNGDVFAFGGCGEKYPLPDPDNVRDLNNYLNCADQGTGPGLGGLGGGFMMQNSGNAACANWTISNSSFLYNLKTNIDFLHCNSTGTFNFYRSRSEGSSGEALKLNVASANIEESQLIANAAVWDTAPFQAIKATKNVNGGSSDYQVCRGNNGIVMASVNGSTFNFLNDDLSSSCTDVIGLSGGNTCSANPIFNIKNSKVVAGYAYDLINSSAGFVNIIFNSSNCGFTWNDDYNSMSNSDNSSLARDPSHCGGAHDKCSTNPNLVGSPFSSTLGPTAYGASTGGTTSLGDQFYLTSSSALKGAGVAGLTYTNGTSKDYNTTSANSPMDMGGLQYNTCIAGSAGPTTGFCSINNQCCSGTCNASQFCTASSGGGGGGGGGGVSNGPTKCAMTGKFTLSGTLTVE